MSKLTDESCGHILLFHDTDRWTRAIAQRAKKLHVAVHSYRDATIAEIELYPQRIFVFEISSLNSLSSPIPLRLLEVASQTQTPILAVADFRLKNQRLALIQTGFAEVIFSATEIPRLIQLAEQFLKKRPSQAMSIEQRVARDLPWSPNSDETGNSTCQSD